MKTSNYGLYKGKTLFYTSGGSFATDMFIKNGDLNEVSGESFPAILADDGKEYNLNKRDVSHISQEDLDKLLPDAHPVFQIITKLNSMSLNFKQRMRFLTYKSTFAKVIEDEGFSPDDIIEFILRG